MIYLTDFTGMKETGGVRQAGVVSSLCLLGILPSWNEYFQFCAYTQRRHCVAHDLTEQAVSDEGL